MVLKRTVVGGGDECSEVGAGWKKRKEEGNRSQGREVHSISEESRCNCFSNQPHPPHTRSVVSKEEKGYRQS